MINADENTLCCFNQTTEMRERRLRLRFLEINSNVCYFCKLDLPGCGAEHSFHFTFVSPLRLNLFSKSDLGTTMVIEKQYGIEYEHLCIKQETMGCHFAVCCFNLVRDLCRLLYVELFVSFESKRSKWVMNDFLKDAVFFLMAVYV